MEAIKWYRRTLLAVALWFFAAHYGTVVADSLKRDVNFDERYRLDCGWVPRTEPAKHIPNDALTKALGNFYVMSAVGLIFTLLVAWETVFPKERRSGVLTVQTPDDLQADLKARPRGGGAHP